MDEVPYGLLDLDSTSVMIVGNMSMSIGMTPWPDDNGDHAKLIVITAKCPDEGCEYHGDGWDLVFSPESLHIIRGAIDDLIEQGEV